MNKFEKLRLSARYYLIGMATHDVKFNKCLEAFEMMLDITKDSVRNGGEPEAIHPLSIFHHTRTFIHSLKDPHDAFVLAFIHDLGEDYNLSVESVDVAFGGKVAQSFDIISKNIGSKKKDSAIYLPNCFSNELAAVIKPIDRNNNLSTMIGVFTPPRLIRYATETRNEYLPRFKDARRLFPHHESIFENLKLQIENQLNLIEHIIKNLKTTND